MNELIGFIIRETGWSLEYIRSLPLEDINPLVEELSYQKSIDEYKMAFNFAMVIANWASAQGRRRYKATDFIGQPPQRKQERGNKNLWQAAKEAGIKMPKT